MAHREEEADPDRPLPPPDHQPGGVVDGRDVVGVEGMPDPERVRERAGAGEHPRARGSGVREAQVERQAG